jgi:hypothetical protein
VGNAYTDRIWKPERKRPLGRPRHTWEDNIKMDILISCDRAS